MPLEPREHGRHYAGGESQRRPIVWTCPSCETKQEGRPEGGCTTCRAGADGVIPERPQPVFDTATLPDYLDQPVGEMEAWDEETAQDGEMPESVSETRALSEEAEESELMKDRTEPQAPPEATRPSTRAAGPIADSAFRSPLERAREAADQRTYAITRKAFHDAFNEIKEQVLLNTPGIYIPEDSRYSLSIALRYLAEQQIAIGPLDGVADHEQLLAWADQLHPDPTASADGAAAGPSEETAL